MSIVPPPYGRLSKTVHLVALHRQFARDRDPGRAGADDGDPLLARRDLGHDVRDAGRLVPLDQEALHRPDRQRPIDVTAAAGALARGGADIRTHRGDRVRIARQDVALLEPTFGGEVEVATAVRPDRAGFLALDVALEPGGVDGLDEEFLGLLDDQAGRAFPWEQDLGAYYGSVSHRPPESTIRSTHAAGHGPEPPGRPVAGSHARLRSSCRTGHRRLRRVDAAERRSYIATRRRCSGPKEHEPRDAGSVTASEFSFLAFGLILGLVTGAALVELIRARPAPAA